MKRRGIIELTPELLLSALRFPDGTELFNVRMDHDTNLVSLLVGIHEDLPIVLEGSQAPVVELLHENFKPRFRPVGYFYSQSEKGGDTQ